MIIYKNKYPIYNIYGSIKALGRLYQATKHPSLSEGM
jgi:hypothetical protein